MAEEKKGLLSRIANKAFSVETIATVALWTVPMFFLFGYIDNAIFDPLFFDVIHAADLSPEMTQWKSAVNGALGWMHDIVGFTGDGGFLHSEFGQSALERFGGPYDVAAGYTPPPAPVPPVNPGAGTALPALPLAPSAAGA